MHTLKILFIFLVFSVNLFAQALSVENVSENIKNALHVHLKGRNKAIVQNIYAQTSYKPVWVGQGSEAKMSSLIQALKDPLFNYKNKAFDQKSIARLFYKLDNGDISNHNKAAVYARLDLMLSNSFVRLVRFLVQGDVDWGLVQKKLASLKQNNNINAKWEMSYKPFPPLKPLLSAAINGNILF